MELFFENLSNTYVRQKKANISISKNYAPFAEFVYFTCRNYVVK